MLIPALCNIVGTFILLSVIITCLPATVPRLLGYEVYNVVSGSMQPEIPVAFHCPLIGELLWVYTSTVGKIYAICFAACGAMFHILAGRLRERAR